MLRGTSQGPTLLFTHREDTMQRRTLDEWLPCRDVDPDLLFLKGKAQNRVKLVCQGCPARIRCLAEALNDRIEFGVWGGMTERERRKLLREHTGVTDWFAHLTEEEHAPGPILAGRDR